jgi:WD40 repeat protein
VARLPHEDVIWQVVFSPDGKYLLSGSGDNAARIWEISTGKEIARSAHDDQVVAVAFSPDGRQAASASLDRTARVWSWQPQDLIVKASANLLRNFTRAEWKKYVGEVLPYQATCPHLPVEAEDR